MGQLLHRGFRARQVSLPNHTTQKSEERSGGMSGRTILRGLKERYENHHHVRIKDDAIIAAVELSNRYITDRFLPDKAIDLMDEAAAKLRMEVDSVPEELDEISRKIKQLEIEREAIKRENDKPKLEQIGKTATAAQTARPPMLVPRITPDGISFFSYIARATVFACIGTNEHGCVTSIG